MTETFYFCVLQLKDDVYCNGIVVLVRELLFEEHTCCHHVLHLSRKRWCRHDHLVVLSGWEQGQLGKVIPYSDS